METKEIQGLVQAVKRGERGRYAVCIDEKWFSGFADECPVRKGDTAVVAYTDVQKGSRTYHNISYVKAGSQSQQSRANGMVERVNRSVALKAAATLHAGNGELEVVLATAEELYQWLMKSASSEPVSAEV